MITTHVHCLDPRDGVSYSPLSARELRAAASIGRWMKASSPSHATVFRNICDVVESPDSISFRCSGVQGFVFYRGQVVDGALRFSSVDD